MVRVYSQGVPRPARTAGLTLPGINSSPLSYVVGISTLVKNRASHGPWVEEQSTAESGMRARTNSETGRRQELANSETGKETERSYKPATESTCAQDGE